tara:strand:- start:12 stop:227 length:216 start_codon:yes stop_codon:yes gene_type:complete
VASKDMIYESRELFMTRFITAGNMSKSYTKSLNMIVINPNKNLEGILSVSKFRPLFYGTSQKIVLDRWLNL